MLTLFLHFVHSVDSADIVVRPLTPANDLAAMVLNKIIDTLRTKVQTRAQRKVNLRGKLFFAKFCSFTRNWDLFTNKSKVNYPLKTLLLTDPP